MQTKQIYIFLCFSNKKLINVEREEFSTAQMHILNYTRFQLEKLNFPEFEWITNLEEKQKKYFTHIFTKRRRMKNTKQRTSFTFHFLSISAKPVNFHSDTFSMTSTLK